MILKKKKKINLDQKYFYESREDRGTFIFTFADATNAVGLTVFIPPLVTMRDSNT